MSPYITPTDGILDSVLASYLNKYFNNIIEENYEKLVMVSAVAYDACNKYAEGSGVKNNKSSEFFKSTMSGVETYVSKIVANKLAWNKNDTWKNSRGEVEDLFDVVEFYHGNRLEHEEQLFRFYNFDKCIVYNHNKDKCNIVI
jgi:hypothetical protein